MSRLKSSFRSAISCRNSFDLAFGQQRAPLPFHVLLAQCGDFGLQIDDVLHHPADILVHGGCQERVVAALSVGFRPRSIGRRGLCRHRHVGGLAASACLVFIV